jgi:hypothetical protein
MTFAMRKQLPTAATTITATGSVEEKIAVMLYKMCHIPSLNN